ncbi:MAG: lactate utilization protein [Flavobacteriaceae bacterium]|nr:lactate utilization protein [Flavobacteriaceae bacterium]
MNLWKRLLGLESNLPQDKLEETSKYMPDTKEPPLDEKFILLFKKNGGKFLYCLNTDEARSNLEAILEEQNITAQRLANTDNTLKELFPNNQYAGATNCQQADCLLIGCENLIAKDGSILLSSHQIRENKLMHLPKKMIVVAYTSQIVPDISNGLQRIKNQCKNEIPSNITTIKQFKEPKENDFLTYGSSAKNLYLLLLEDY